MLLENTILQERSVSLKKELKEWERKFAERHNGQKPGRDDIKADAAIAAKYKQYQSTRDVLSGKVSKEVDVEHGAARGKRKAMGDLPHQSPPRKQKLAETPQKSSRFMLENFHSPQTARKLFTPIVKRAFMGPTPQKDGHVLGLFDLMPSESPSKVERTPLKDIAPNLTRTPQKTTLRLDDIFTPKARLERTPQSSGKRFLLDSFLTPQKRKASTGAETPSSSMKRLATPAFLRRDSQRLDTLQEEPESPQTRQPWIRRPLGRSLSSMIREMREQAEHEHDDDEEAMREAESGMSFAKPIKKPTLLVTDSQEPSSVQLRPDGFLPSDMESEEELEVNEAGARPRKPWKKKGLKRQTRRVIMRPTQRPAAPKPVTSVPEESDEDDGDAENVPETQLQEGDDASFSDDEPQSAGQENLDAGQKIKKVAKKISATAHANFRKLKIKNKNSKANGRGRFGNRRR